VGQTIKKFKKIKEEEMKKKLITCGCEGSCPVCRIGEVANHECNRCHAKFCPKCHGITNDTKSENVLFCKCEKEFEIILKISKTKKTKLKRGDIIAFRGQRHNYMRIYRPSIKKWLYFVDGEYENKCFFMNGAMLGLQDLSTLASLLSGVVGGLKIKENFEFQNKFNVNFAFELI
jgi:hypothetical protein